LEEITVQQADLQQLCANRSLVSNDLFPPNDFYGMGNIIKKYADLPDLYTLKGIIPHGIVLHEKYRSDPGDFAMPYPLPAILCYQSNLVHILRKTEENDR